MRPSLPGRGWGLEGSVRVTRSQRPGELQLAGAGRTKCKRGARGVTRLLGVHDGIAHRKARGAFGADTSRVELESPADLARDVGILLVV